MSMTTTEFKQADPVILSRIFPAPRSAVFKAWSSAEHVRAWFSPATYTCPDAQVEMKVGGAFNVCMRSPAGEDHWTRGVFTEVVPYDRLALDIGAVGADGMRLFRAYTEVTFSEVASGTRMDVVQTYTFENAELAAPMVAGASEGWRTTLDKLATEVVRIMTRHADQEVHVAAKARIPEVPTRTVTHGSFSLERTYDAPAARVWQALSTQAAKDKWFGAGPDKLETLERSVDVRVGGRERLKGRWIAGGVVSTFDALYYDVIPNERLVYAYEMHIDERKISVSLATMELRSMGAKTRLLVSEQGAFLDGYDDAGSREHGTGELLDALGASLKA